MNEKILISVTTPLDKKVMMNKSVYYDHICVNHKELQGNISSIKETLKNPDIINESAICVKSDVYYSYGTAKNYPNTYTKVVVDNMGEIGVVKTAMLTKTINKKEETIYVKANTKI